MSYIAMKYRGTNRRTTLCNGHQKSLSPCRQSNPSAYQDPEGAHCPLQFQGNLVQMFNASASEMYRGVVQHIQNFNLWSFSSLHFLSYNPVAIKTNQGSIWLDFTVCKILAILQFQCQNPAPSGNIALGWMGGKLFSWSGMISRKTSNCHSGGWEETQTLLMWPWPARMGRWKPTRWSSPPAAQSLKGCWRRTSTIS